MVLKEFLILIVVYFQVTFAGSEYFKDGQPRCHLQTFSCPCELRHGEQLYVAIRKCASNNLNVCGGKAVIRKCKTAYLSQKRQRRDTGSNNLHCDHGTNKTRPNVTINGSSKNLLVDGTVRFECTVFSNLPANVTWLFNGASLAEKVNYIEGWHSFMERNCRTAILNIDMLSSKDTGNYTCVVQNEIGKAMASSYLTVTSKNKGPYIQYMRLEGKIGSNTAVLGSSLNLTCETQDDGVLNIFKKDGARVYEGDASHYEIHNMEDKKRNAKVANLEIKNVTFKDTGNYTCVAVLHGMLATKTFYLKIVNASQSCIPGHYCPPGSQQPIKCPAGTYQPSTGALSKNDCRPCDPGHYCTLPGSQLPDDLCRPGYHCPRGSISPVPCPWGSYQPLAGTSTCNQCENRNFSKKPDYYTHPAVNVTDFPPGYRPTGGSGSEMGKEQQFTTGITFMETVGLVFGILGAVVIILMASICITKKWPWLSSYKTRKTSSTKHDLESSP